MEKTPKYDYNVPIGGTEDWHVPLDENSRQFDSDIELRDSREITGPDDLEGKEGANYFNVDTGIWANRRGKQIVREMMEKARPAAGHVTPVAVKRLEAD